MNGNAASAVFDKKLTVKVDGGVLFKSGTIAQVIVKAQTCVVDEDVERLNSSGSRLNLLCVGYVQDSKPKCVLASLEHSSP
jgi:hypothetical protein